MAEPLADQVLRKIGEVCCLYHRLILIVGPAGSGKTSALQEVSASTSLSACGHAQAGAPLVNVNLELSRRMLDLTERQRALQLPRLLGEIVPACRAGHGAGRGEATGDLPAATLAAQAGLVLLDNIEFRCPPEAGSFASASGIVPEQDGRGRLERIHRGWSHDLRRPGPPRIPPLPDSRFSGGQSGPAWRQTGVTT